MLARKVGGWGERAGGDDSRVWATDQAGYRSLITELRSRRISPCVLEAGSRSICPLATAVPSIVPGTQ